MPRSLLAAAVLALSACLSPAGAQQDFASQITRIVVPFAAGGGTDVIARTVAQELGKELGGTVIVENKPGAGTVIGTDFVAKAQPDGHTLVMATFAHAVNPRLREKLPFDTDKDFAPVSLVARSFNIAVVNPNSGINSIADLIKMAKEKPDALNFGTFGPGTSAHLAGELFKSMAGVKLTPVHYRGAAPAITDLLGGSIQVMFTTAASVTSLVKDGRLKALAVTSSTRAATLPDVPAIAETVPGYAAESWYGLFAPAKTPAPVIALLSQAADKAIRSSAFDKLVANEGLILVGGAPEALGTYVQGEQARWRKALDDAGIKPE